MLGRLIAFAGITLLVAACGNRSSVGSGNAGSSGTGASSGTGGTGGGTSGAGGTGGGTWEPCAGKPCGARCTICPPQGFDSSSGAPSCSETSIDKFCQSDGSCSDTPPKCTTQQCGGPKDCAAIGAPCEPCPDGVSYSCPSVDCINGQCVYSQSSCPGQCTSTADCPQMGAPCQPCPDGSMACPSVECINGQCVGGFPGCPGWDPCANKTCGQTCTQCPPDDPNCFETAVLKYCDQHGTCSGTVPNCGGGSTCSANSDCAAIELCKDCGDGSCAEPMCVKGQCELVCSVQPPECTSDDQCPMIAVCQPCNNGSCAQAACLDGKCQLVCN